MNRFWSNWVADDFKRNLSNHLAILPLAATEQHGPHLPLGTDSIIARGLIERADSVLPKKCPAVFLPLQTIGASPEHCDFAGTLSLDWQSAIRIWIGLGESVAGAGVKKLLLITSHGGNMPAMEIAARQLRLNRNMLTACAQWENLGADMCRKVRGSQEPFIDIHGGEFETSLILALRPDLARMRKAENFQSAQTKMKKGNKFLAFHSSPAKLAWAAQDLNKKGVVGRAKEASAQKGEKMLDEMASGFAHLCQEMLKTPAPTRKTDSAR